MLTSTSHDWLQYFLTLSYAAKIHYVRHRVLMNCGSEFKIQNSEFILQAMKFTARRQNIAGHQMAAEEGRPMAVVKLLEFWNSSLPRMRMGIRRIHTATTA